MSPLLSVILPVRDAAATLPAALSSLSAQSFADFELILIDHGSSDGTRALFGEWDGTFAQLRKSAISARTAFADVLNWGCTVSRGRFVARMDADDVCLPDRFRLQVEHLLQHPETGVVSSRVAYGGDPRAQSGYARYVEWINGLMTHEAMALVRFRESPLAHPSVMFRRELLETHGGYRDGLFPEDYELWLRWFQAGVRFAKLPETLLTWNDPPTRLSRVHPNYAFKNFYAVKAEYLARWLARNNPHHPDVLIVGAGRVTRRRVEKLIEKGIRVKAWADLDPDKIGRVYHGAPVIHHDAIPPPGAAFVVPFVSAIGAPEHIRALLESRGHVRGRDFIEAA